MKNNKRIADRYIKVSSYEYYEDVGNARYKENPGYRMGYEKLNISRTAMIIMDPWKDGISQYINTEYKKIIEENIYPLAKLLLAGGGKVIIFTNRPGRQYTCRINNNLQRLVNEGKADLLYHEEMSSPLKFSRYLKRRKLSSLIYTGFTIHQCLLFRPTGILSMWYRFKTGTDRYSYYVVPECIGAIRSKDKNETEQMKRDIIIMLSQGGIAKIIEQKNLEAYLKRKIHVEILEGERKDVITNNNVHAAETSKDNF